MVLDKLVAKLSNLDSGLRSIASYSDQLRAKLEAWITELSTDDDARSRSVLHALRAELRAAQRAGYSNCAQNVAALEAVYVCLLGHHCEDVREAAVVDLNVLYDAHDMQASDPLPVTIACAGDAPLVSVEVRSAHHNPHVLHYGTSFFDPQLIKDHGVVFRIFGPSEDRVAAPRWSELPLTLSPEKGLVECQLPAFPCPGYYDWVVAKSGETTPASVEGLIDSARRLRGRFIVQPRNMREAMVVEVPVDEVGATWDEKTGKLYQRGSFHAVINTLPTLKKEGATAIYLMGSLQRADDDPDASPLSVADRESPATALGGRSAFASLVAETRRLGMTPIVDGIDRVSRTRMHRKYRSLTVETLTSKGIPLRHPGTDGRENQWEDTALLNYRRVETWNLMVSEIKSLAANFGVRGVRLDNAQSLPPILAPHMDELLRMDPDGEPHYSLSEIFYGAVVRANEEQGYWTSAAGMEGGYPNPFLVKFCREMWNAYPDFIVMAESHFHREAQLLMSGAIAHTVRLPQILASISGKSMRRDGTVARLPDKNKSTARTLSRLYRNDREWLPKNAIMVNCTCTHLSPYPGVLYGRRAWLAVDMLYFLPEVPMHLFGEERGRSYRMHLAPVSTVEELTEYDVNFDAVLPKSPPKRTGQTSPGDAIIPPLSLSASSGVVSPLNSDRSKTASVTSRSVINGLPPPSPPMGGVDRKPKMKRKASMAEISMRRTPSNSSLVRSRSRDDMKGLSVRSMSVNDLKRMSDMEEQTRQEIGPSSGFDLAQIKGHYAHRMLLRQDLEVLRRGGMCVLTVDPQLKQQVFAFARFTKNQIVVVAINFSDSRDGVEFAAGCDVELDFRPLWDQLPPSFTTGAAAGAFYSVVDAFTGAEHSHELNTLEELTFRKYGFHLAPLGMVMLELKPLQDTPSRRSTHLSQCLHRLLAVEAADIKDPRENNLIANIARGAARSASDFAASVDVLRCGLQQEGCDSWTIERVVQLAVQRASQLLFMVAYEGAPAPRDFEPPPAERIVAYLTHMSTSARDGDLLKLARTVVTKTTKLGPLVFVSAELGRFSTAGGLGVMVDELTKGLAVLGLEVYVISPYYTVNRKNQTGYLGDDIRWTRNVSVNLGTHVVETGVFEGVEHGVNLIFLERGDYFPKVYADPGGAARHLQTVVLLSLGSLEVCCQKGLVPSLIVTNDWLPSMAPGYRDFFGDYFNNTAFFHLIHNLGGGAYEGRCYPSPQEGSLAHIHRLPEHQMVNPWWSNKVVNPSRCAIMRSDSWGTVSPSYLKELLGDHPLSDLLQVAKSPFAYPNGIRKAEREEALLLKGAASHAEAKEILQRRYFGFETGDPSIPLFAFVGRITNQKGVHLILNAVDELIALTSGKIQILVGGPANYSDTYAADCARHMHDLRRRHPWCFWAAPDDFFTDGPMCNLGADFGLMPSLFEPGGIVQQEFFIAKTPVVAYKTGGLKDTVNEWKSDQLEGNGFCFEQYTHTDFVCAVKRALRVFAQPEEYEELRYAAYETTIDVSEVAWAWSSELHRLRNAMYTRGDVVGLLISSTAEENSELYHPSAKATRIEWTGKGSAVILKGSFDEWAAEWPLTSTEGGPFAITLRLRPGEYMYKFKVDQAWTVSDEHDKKEDSAGFTNNVMVVV